MLPKLRHVGFRFGCRHFSVELWNKPGPRTNPKRAADRIRDAVPLRMGLPRADWPQDVMIIGICPKDGGGLVKFRWYTLHRWVVTKEFLIPRGLPGEVVTVAFGKVTQKKWPMGDIDVYVNPSVKKVRRSAYEVSPACPHYNSCGGCDFLDLSYGRQLIEKRRWIERALIGSKVPLNTLERIRPSTPQKRYALRAEWMFREDDGEVLIGPPGAPEDRPPGEPLYGCVLAPRAAIRTLSICADSFMQLRELRRRSYSVFDDVHSWGTFRSIVALTGRGLPQEDGKRRTEVLLNIVLGNDVEDVQGVLQPLANAVVEAAPSSLVGVVANMARSKRTIMGGRREYLLYGRRYVRQTFQIPLGLMKEMHTFVLEMGAGSRIAAHAGILRELSETVIDMCDLSETDILWHCFCSGGELSLAAGRLCQHVVAIGTSATEVGELKRNLAANEVTNTTAVLCNLQSPFTLKQLSFHISQSQQKRLLLGDGREQDKARDYALTCFVPGESRRRLIQRLTASPFNAPLLREDALAHQELRVLLPAFVREFRPNLTTLPVPTNKPVEEEQTREVTPDMENRLKRLYRRLAMKYHPDKNPNDPEASDRFQALTRAYKALVGDTAGPEEGDEDAKDPFQVAHESSYRIKAKHFWRYEGKVQQGSRNKQQADEEESSDEEMDDTDAKVAEAFGLPDDEKAKGKQAKARRKDDDEERDEDSDFEVELEIDEGWAKGPSNNHSFQRPKRSKEKSFAQQNESMEVLLKDGDTRLTQAGTDKAAPTLPPPDVVLVCQPRNRKKGKGTPKYFQSWLRSTAARSIVYVSVDSEAFQADAAGLRDLGYHVTKVQPFDPEPHRKGVLLVAKFELIRPLEGLEEYKEHTEQLLPGMPDLLPPRTPVPLLVSQSHRALPPRS